MASMKRKWIWVIGGMVLLIGLFVALSGRRNQATAAEIGGTAVVFVGDLAESVSASGQVAAVRQAALSLTASGVVEQVNVAVGDTVQAGDVLVQLDTAALARAVASAELEVTAAQADLDALLADPTPEDIAAARAAVRNARARLDDLLDGPSEDELAASKASVRAAQANVSAAQADLQATQDVSEADIMEAQANLQDALDQQQAAHDIWTRLADCEENEDGSHTCTPVDNNYMETATQNVQSAKAKVALAQARLDELSAPDAHRIASAQAALNAAVARYDAAVARHEALVLGATDAEIAAAQADLAQAQASLENLLSGPSETDVAIYETRVAQAETALQQARNALADAILVAPFDGVITAVHVNQGERATGLAVTIVDRADLEVILSVDQVDLGRLTVGQPAVATLETWLDEEISATITAIAPRAMDSESGVAAYEVHLSLGETTLPVRVGMTANADLITARQEGVLLVPNAALTADRQAGTYSVDRVHTDAQGNQTITAVPVTIGLQDDQYTQIIDGLSEGDQVRLSQLDAQKEQTLRPGQRLLGNATGEAE